MTGHADRSTLRAHASQLVAHAARIDYVERRPMVTREWYGHNSGTLIAALEAGRRIAMDCSEAITLLFNMTGLEDPNGLGYDGYGNTGTMLGHLPKGDLADAHAGAILIFGGTVSRQHATMVLEPHPTNPLVFSHGSQIGPLAIRLADERRVHAGQPLYALNVTGL